MIKKIIALLLCMAGAAAWIGVNQTQGQEVFRPDEEPLLDRVVVLDAGHGGIDGGVVGITTKTREASVNLSVTKKLAVLLESAGIKVVMTRTGEASLCADDIYTKKLDMRLRGEVIDAAKPDMIISIHMNSYPDPSVHGAQCFSYPGSAEGARLAAVMQESLRRYADPSNKRIPKEEDFFMLRTSSSPSVLVECGFMTCPAEEKLLLTEDYQDKLAYAIFCGVFGYFLGEQSAADQPQAAA